MIDHFVGVVLGAAAEGDAEEAEAGAEVRAHGHVDEKLPERVANAQPEDGEVDEGDVEPVAGQALVERDADER